MRIKSWNWDFKINNLQTADWTSEIWDFDKPFVFNEQFFQPLTCISNIILGHKRQDKGFRLEGSLLNSRDAKPTVTARTGSRPDKGIVQCQRKRHGFSYPGAYGAQGSRFSTCCPFGLLCPFPTQKPAPLWLTQKQCPAWEIQFWPDG